MVGHSYALHKTNALLNYEWSNVFSIITTAGIVFLLQRNVVVTQLYYKYYCDLQILRKGQHVTNPYTFSL